MEEGYTKRCGLRRLGFPSGELHRRSTWQRGRISRHLGGRTSLFENISLRRKGKRKKNREKKGRERRGDVDGGNSGDFYCSGCPPLKRRVLTGEVQRPSLAGPGKRLLERKILSLHQGERVCKKKEVHSRRRKKPFFFEKTFCPADANRWEEGVASDRSQ